MWKGELDKKKKTDKLESRTAMKTSGDGQRWGRSQEKEGGMHGAWESQKKRLGWERRGKDLAPDSAHQGSLWTLRQMTQTRTPGRACFCTRSQVQQLWHRAHTEYGDELKP